jgi:hypothetical protein
MKVDTDGKPRVGTKGYMLGIRPTDPANTGPRRRADTAAITDDDPVSPLEGLSTATNPAVLVARPGEVLFVIESDDLPAGLEPNEDHPPHCLIQPALPMPLRDYQQALADTRDLWAEVQ